MNDYSSIERQQEIARQIWERQQRAQEVPPPYTPPQKRVPPEVRRAPAPPDRAVVGALLKECREALDLDPETAAENLLHGIITLRRLRRVEQGYEDVPPRAWQAYAAALREADRSDLVERIAAMYPAIGL